MTEGRRPDWEDRLSATVAKLRDRPHEWGRHDCLLFAAEVVKAVTGKDHGRGHRRKYKSMAGAYRHLSTLGFDSPEALLDSLFEEKKPGFAQRGDLVLTKNGNPALCMGAFALAVGEEGSREGLVEVPRGEWMKAWAVGEHHSGERALKRRKKAKPDG